VKRTTVVPIRPARSGRSQLPAEIRIHRALRDAADLALEGIIGDRALAEAVVLVAARAREAERIVLEGEVA
jgi:hypothetical protein